ncbi:MAG: translocation/assembly module TamB domain-containing protein [Bacteroidales bacterium]|nr:translocation/assembly module TamB domain-containing protein [Bacteroidales bacterium]
MNSEIKIGSIYISISLDIVLNDVLINDQKGNRILKTERLEFDIERVNLKNNILKLAGIDLKSPDINLIKYKGDSAFSFKFLTEYFKSEDNNIDTTEIENKEKWKFDLNKFSISDGHFVFQNNNKRRKDRGVDYADMDISEINLDIQKIRIENDTFNFIIEKLSAKDKCGFNLKDFSGRFRLCSKSIYAGELKICTNNSELSLDLIFAYSDFSDFDDFEEKISIQTTIQPSKLNIYDIGFFAPSLSAMDNPLSISGNISGRVNNLKAKNFTFNYGESSKFDGNININGLPNVEESFVHFSINEFKTNIKDVESLKLPIKSIHLQIPDVLKKFGKIDINGFFTGFYNDFNAKINLSTSIGKINTDVVLKNNREKKHIEYNGKIAANQFNLGNFLSSEKYLGYLNFYADFSGSGFSSESAVVELNGMIDSLQFMRNNFNTINLKGELAENKFNGSLNIMDELLNFDFDGIVDFKQKLPVFNFSSKIRNAKLYDLNILSHNPNIDFSSNLLINFVGSSIDDIFGSINIDSTKYYEDNKLFYLDHFALITLNDTSVNKNINLKSDIVDAEIKGDFLLTELFPSIINFIDNYISADILFEVDSVKFEDIYIQDFEYSINLKKTNSLCELLYPSIKIGENTKFAGKFNSSEKLFNLKASSPLIDFKGSKLFDWFLESESFEEKFLIKTGSKRLSFKETSEKDTLQLGLDSLMLSSEIMNDSINYNIYWNNISKDNYRGDFSGWFSLKDELIKTKITNAEIVVNDSMWTISKDNFIVINENSIIINDFSFIGNNQKLKIDGKISKVPEDTINFEFSNWSISNFDLFLDKKKFDINGIINGRISLSDLLKSPSFFSDFKIDSLYFNGEDFGEAFFFTKWNSQTSSINVDAEIFSYGNVGKTKSLEVSGHYFPYNTSNNYDFNINLSNFKLISLSPFINSFASDIEGLASGKFTLKGPMKKPDLRGKLSLIRAGFRIAYLNTKYSLANDIEFAENKIIFDEIILYDTLGNEAICSGKIQHNYLNDFNLDLNISINKFSCLNTDIYQNKEFYGEAIASGNVKISGPFNNISMDIVAKPDKGTLINIPLSSAVNVSETNYIVFVNNTDTVVKQEDYRVDLSGLNLSLDLNITPDAQIAIFLPSQMGNIKAVGSGDIKLEINSRGNFSINGDYVIDNGSFLFTIQNMLNRKFEIIKGGKISWTGSPYDAEINMKALYKVKTSLAGLGANIDTTSNYKSRVNVDCILGLKNQLMNPEITSSIKFPNIDEQTAQAIYSILDTTNQALMNQQMISLLVLNSFSYNTGDVGSLGVSSLGFISGALSNWLSQISKDFDIGINYTPGDKISEEELQVALSTQLFDDRVSIDGNFGVVGDEKSQRTSNIVGDVNVEVKITQDGRLRIRAFNRTNDIDILEDNSPYTQGVGVFYRKEFNSFRDLVQWLKKKKKGSK